MSTPNSEERDRLAEIIQDVGEYIPGSHAEDYTNPYKAADAVLAAGYRRQEGEVEYALRADGDAEPYSDVSEDPDWLCDEAGGSYAERGDHLVRRRKAGPWVPVTEEGGEQ